MRMKFLRILPETCARTWCLFSSSTRNMALGNGSITVAITSIASSLLINSLLVPGRDPSLRSGFRLRAQTPAKRLKLLCQNQRAVLGHGHAVLKVCAVAAIFSDRGPLVFQDAHAGLAGIDH